ncbi:MAG: Sensor protein [Labilithrix sp.]|nr:Sensor protein [Labilithrix sp.]
MKPPIEPEVPSEAHAIDRTPPPRSVGAVSRSTPMSLGPAELAGARSVEDAARLAATAKINVLIVDDEPANLLALEAILEPLNLSLVRALSGKEALRAALKDDYAVVLLDVQMPDMDGFETAELLRSRTRTRDVPIIFLTAISKDAKFISRGYGVGAVDYLFKPYEPDILKAKVAVFVDLARKNALIRAQHEALRLMSERELAEVKKVGEQRYVGLADSMPLIVWTTDASGALSYANRRWTELAGDALAFDAVIAPEDLPRFLEGWTAALASGREWEASVRFGNANRGYRMHLVRVVPRRDELGKISFWTGTSTDIEARVSAERAVQMLADASRRLGATLEAPTELEGAVAGALPLLGDLALLQLVGNGPTRSFFIASAGADPGLLEDPRFALGPATVAYSRRPAVFYDVAAEVDDTKSGRGTEHVRFLYELGVRSYMCLPLVSRGRAVGTLSLVRITDGAPFGASELALAEDLGLRIAAAVDNARLHETTERRREELEQANKSKDVFLATLSHELRTPLNAIVGWADMMRNGQLAEGEVPRAIETIDRNAHALNQLVADLLDVSRIVTGSLKIDSKLIALTSVVETAVEAARPPSTAKRVTLDVSLEPVGCVKGDAGRLRQIIGNLLSNAIKFAPEGGTVKVRVTRDGPQGKIVVEDNGEGITADFLPHVFERFRQAEDAKARGLGLGLAIVKHLVEEHGGSVSAASEGAGKGACFTLLFPIVAEESEAEPERGRSLAPLSAPQLAGVHALVVEDDPDGNELITTILERYGARVTSVGTAAGALEALEAEPPTILVSDIGLPDSDGMELIRTVRKRFDAKSLPAIALTAYASRQDAAKAIAAGFDAHVAKPVQPSTLGNAVARLLARDGGDRAETGTPEISPQPEA